MKPLDQRACRLNILDKKKKGDQESSEKLLAGVGWLSMRQALTWHAHANHKAYSPTTMLWQPYGYGKEWL